MAKIKIQFKCNSCGYVVSKFMGKCPSCNEWNAFEEYIEEEKVIIKSKATLRDGNSEAVPITKISNENIERLSTGMSECDRVLGGGLVSGSLVLIAGQPGVGKSTIFLQIFGNLSKKGVVLYVSGEESKHQIKLRANRLNISSENLLIMSETHINSVIDKIKEIHPIAVIIDSIQTMVDPTSSSIAGSTSQIKQCGLMFMDLANTTGIPIILVGHITKDGDLAGPKHLEHMVDAVLYFEGDRQQQIRILRTEKNRFGSTNEVGIFEMQDVGLVEVSNPSELFMSEDTHLRSGSAVMVTMEGTRPLLAEIQALVTPTTFNYPRRMAIGIDNNKVVLICAVLEKRLSIPLSRFDIYINVVGGLKIPESCVDLAVATAIMSSMQDVPLPEKTIVLGELGLTGEVRNIPQLSQRINEAKKLGWENIVVPNGKIDNTFGVNLIKVKTLMEVFNALWKNNKD